MWALRNFTPYEAERTWVRDKDGVHWWVVVVKATYDIDADGTLRLSKKPLLPMFAPEYSGLPGQSSVRYDADMVAMKPATDVYLNAIAYAPVGEPCKRVDVSARIGQVNKALHVFGNRVWQRSLLGGVTPSAPEPFATMRITYEGAFGGFDQTNPNPRRHRIDFRNPVGTGVAYDESQLLGTPAYNVVDPRQQAGKGWPAGFGAIDSFWSPRKELTGTYDDQWKSQRFPLLPIDYDSRCLLCSPLDQQVHGYLKGGESVELTNLTPSGWLRFAIPAESLQFETFFGATRKEHASELVTVVVESEGPRLILVWQTTLRCGNDGDYLDQTVIRQKGRGT